MADAVFASNVSNVAAEDVVPRTKIGEILDMRAKKLQLQKAKELYPYEIEAGKAQSQSAQTAANTAQLQNIQAHQQNASREMLKVLNQLRQKASYSFPILKLSKKIRANFSVNRSLLWLTVSRIDLQVNLYLYIPFRAKPLLRKSLLPKGSKAKV